MKHTKKKWSVPYGTFVLLLSFIPSMIHALSLDEALNDCALKSPSIRELRLEHMNRELDYANYLKGYLPSVSMQLTPISLNRSLRLLQDFYTGDYNYVTDYSYTGDAELTLSQKVGISGGTLMVGSSLNFLREMSENRNSYNTSPFFVSYSQPLFGGFRNYQFMHAIRRMSHDIADKNYCQSVSNVQQEVLALYLNAYLAKLQLKSANQSLSVGDTLLNLARLKLENGYITKFDYNKIELQQLNTKLGAEQARHNLESSLADMALKLGLDHVDDVDAPDASMLPARLEYDEIVLLVKANNPQALNMTLQQKQAAYEHYNSRRETRMNGNVSLSYGLNQYAATLPEAYRHPDERQSVSVTLSIPIFDWGISRNKRRMADNTYESAMLKIDESMADFENKVRKQTIGYNMAQGSFKTAERSLELSQEQYRLATVRFAAGKVSVYELTQAFETQQNALTSYFNAVREVFTQYYSIRHITLYDFVNRQTLEEQYARK